ncbi:hypothetical protein AX769_00575 [Frondihabitans sp. PAMC 28766]|uniref:LacI family DNA-binding transcriptional regulator n=1 Tax=Frondihabitans sp. PAMC 28766 TaxID=1795630 RepID=UPI00078D735E|nr:LacI family DNA-binding transcriptional regulator [Frondihabitans sp. PAMC 28766]AMM18907.1 hypothetical protein AX769_00575 [Frondihabitans sp. PAMC 28766]
MSRASERAGGPKPRITIVDVARAAGVSKGAASHALNGRLGVSEETRQRVKAAAVDLGWSPNSVARALSGARAGAIGWAIVRSAKSATIDPYVTQLFIGIELGLADTDVALVVKLVADRTEEEALYRRWASSRRVDGVVVTDIDADERRFALLDDLGLPVAAFRSYRSEQDGDRSKAGRQDPETASVPSVWLDEQRGVDVILNHAHELGHRRIAWISGDPVRSSVLLREVATLHWAEQHPGALVSTEWTDYSAAEGAATAERLLRRAEPPTFLVFDNDLMALSGLSMCHALGLRVPEEVSVASFIDSDLCDVGVPPITALHHETVAFGEQLATRLVGVVDGAETPDVVVSPLRLRIRPSTGPAPA